MKREVTKVILMITKRWERGRMQILRKRILFFFFFLSEMCPVSVDESVVRGDNSNGYDVQHCGDPQM